MNKYHIIHSYFEDGGQQLVLPNVQIEQTPYHNFLLLLQGHNFPILCSYLIRLPNMENCWETHISELEKRYRKNGYGKLMYEHMIDFAQANRINVVSSKHTSKSATRLWESLIKEKQDAIYFTDGRYVVKNFL